MLERRYLVAGETAADRFWAVAWHVAGAWAPDGRLERARRFYRRMARLEFLPNSPTLRNAGRPDAGTLAACYVIPVDDSWEGIAEARRQAGWVQKYGGGTGFDFSRLRPRGSPIGSTQGSACGPVAVLRDFNQLSDTLTQGQGAFRKGANMGILRIDHPDIEEFIHCKDDGSAIQNFNISVAVTQVFMDALDGRSSWATVYADVGAPGDLSAAHVMPLHFSGQVHRWVDARDLWRAICDSAWRTGDPGLYFIDTAEAANPTPHLGRLEATNPCGEVPLLAYEPCNLGSINVAKFLHPEPGSGRWLNELFDLEALRACVRDAVEFLDGVVTVGDQPTPEIAAANARTRKIGLGVMGWHDALIALRIPYASPEAVTIGRSLMAYITAEAQRASADLARRYGPYPAYQGPATEAVRNATRTCIAPTGTISLIAGCSSGIEPLFARHWTRRMEDGTVLTERHPAWTGADGAPVPEYLHTALEIAPEWHVRMQAAFQDHTDLAVSKTVNLPRDATVADIDAVYRLAHALGCKGITVFRDGCREAQVIMDAARPAPPEATVPADALTWRRHVTFRDGFNLYIHVGFDEAGRPIEVFLNAGKAGTTLQGLLHALARTLSTALQHGVPMEALARRLAGMTFAPAGMTDTPDIPVARSLVDYVAQYLLRVHPPGVAAEGPPTEAAAFIGLLCPQCGSGAETSEGCLVCRACGYAQCG